MKRPTIRHIIRIAEGKLITIEGERRVEANYREFHTLNTVTALETAFKGMGFRLISEMADEVIYQKSIKGGANPMTKTCTVPGCNQPRMTSRKGKPLTMCEAHQKEYWRDHKSSRNGSGKRGKPSAAPVLPPPELPLHIRIIALRCTACGVKQPYTDEVFDVAANARICRRCADAVAVVR